MPIIKKENAENNSQSEETKRLLQSSEVSLILDTYDDIFSDFDPRPFVQRALSHDFLEEAKRATRDLPSGGIQLKFLIPYQLRNITTEIMIKKRLKEHFKKHHLQLTLDLKKLRTRGILMALFGVILILIATYLVSLSAQNIILRFFEVVLEPAGWFTSWTGLEDIYWTGRDISKEHQFYNKMSESNIEFISY